MAELTIGNAGHRHAGGASPVADLRDGNLDGFVRLTESSTVDLRLDLRFLAILRERVTVLLIRKAMI